MKGLHRNKMTLGVLALLATAATGCTASESGDDGGGAADTERLDAMLEENNRLIAELVDIQGRLIEDCLEEAGHTVHDENQFVMWDFGKRPLPDLDQGSLPWLIDREIAADWGFGIWTSWDTMYGSEEHLEFEALAFGDEVRTFTSVDNAAFDSLPSEERFAWYVAYYGEPRARVEQAHLTDDPGEVPPGGLIGTVAPEGCMGEVTAALDLEPAFVPQPDYGDEVGTWSTYPVPPGLELLTSGSLDDEVRAARTSDLDFLVCLETAGWGQWEFNEEGDLNVRHFIERAYGHESAGGAFEPAALYTEGVPEESPEDVPTDTEGRRAWESGFSMDLWACVDETGLEADAEQAWADAYGTELLAMEADIYAWQEEMGALITDGQELLGA